MESVPEIGTVTFFLSHLINSYIPFSCKEYSETIFLFHVIKLPLFTWCYIPNLTTSLVHLRRIINVGQLIFRNMSYSKIPVLLWGLSNKLNICDILTAYTEVSYLTHWGRGHLNCLNARSRGLNNLNQLLYCVSLNIYNKFANYFCEL